MAEKVRDLSEIIKEQELLDIEKNIALNKAINSDDPNNFYKAKKYLESQQTNNDGFGGKSMVVDPQSAYKQGGYRDKPVSLSFPVLRGMGNTDIIKAIRVTRKAQISNFLSPQKDKYSTGFVIQKKKKNIQNKQEAKLTKQEEARIEYLTKFILECGVTNNKWHGDSLETWAGKIVDDSLNMDSAVSEIVRNRKGEPIEFFAVDGATIRLAETYWGDPENKYPDLAIQGYFPAYVQVYQDRIINQFYPWELMYGVRNPSTDINQNGYGESELERMIQTVTAILNTTHYNANFFKVGSAPKGILRYSGNINQNTVDDFRKQWQAQLAGVDNMHKMAIINADKMDFISTMLSNKDMEFGKFQDFLIKIACALFLIDPAEIGFPMEGNSEGKAPVFGGSNEARLKWSKDKGLKPLLKFLAVWLNKYVVSELDPEYELVFVGMDDEMDAEKELDADIKKVGAFETVDELRARRNMDPLPNGQGQIILNPVFMQAKQLASMGDPNANDAVDEMDQENEGDQGNPFMEALRKGIEETLTH